MSLNFYLDKCSDDVKTNGKVTEKFGEQALYSLSMACMACGVTALKTDADCERLYDRARVLEIIPHANRADWWKFIVAMKGFSTNATARTDAQFAKQLIDRMKYDGQYERRNMPTKGDA